MNGSKGRVKMEKKKSGCGNRVVDLVSSPPSSPDGTPLRPIFCLKKVQDMKRVEENEDCFILEFDPSDSLKKISSPSVSNPVDDGVSIVAEKGQVACRDYAHSRHLCLKFPFDSTQHENFCKQCYCYVCDVPAPCKHWTRIPSAHCDAAEKIGDWKQRRNLTKVKKGLGTNFHGNPIPTP